MITIDKIKRSDLVELASLYEELLGEKTNMENMKESFSRIDSNPDYMLVGAKDSEEKLLGSVLGIICHDIVGECKPFMVIDNVIVKSGCRGLGVGKKLMTFIEDYARERGCYYTIFVSSSYRKEAHKFYESIGYDNDLVRGFKKYL